MLHSNFWHEKLDYVIGMRGLKTAKIRNYETVTDLDF